MNENRKPEYSQNPEIESRVKHASNSIPFWKVVGRFLLLFIIVALLLGDDNSCCEEIRNGDPPWLLAWLPVRFATWLVMWLEWFKNGIEPAWRISVVLGGIVALVFANQRAKTADEHAQAANKQAETANKQAETANEQAKVATDQADISFRSHLAQRYEKASEMLWHQEEAGMREAGCYALKSLGQLDVHMAMQCRDLLVSFIQHSSSTQKQKEEKQEEMSRYDIVAADQSLSSLYQKWWEEEEFTSFLLDDLPSWFWRKKSGSNLGYPKINLYGAVLNDPELDKFNLNESHHRAADLSWVNLRGANLGLSRLPGALLGKTDFTDADLTNAYLPGARLIHAKLINAKLCKADLTDADLTNADLKDADLTDAILNDANFIKAKHFTEKQLLSAEWDIGHPPKVPPHLEETMKRSHYHPPPRA